MTGKCRCKSGHKVVSWSEREIDDWLYDLGYQTIYEPAVPTENGNLIADWLILPQKGLDKPVIIEYWGLLREDNRAQWVEQRLPRYQEKKIYKEIQKYAISELTDIGTVSASSVITQIIRLHQISCGFVSTDESVVTDIKNNRTEELLQILEETEGKVIIWANYRHDIKRIYSLIAKEHGEESVGTYYGDTSDADREDLITKFQDKDSPLRFFVGNTQTGGYGITLTAASTVVYFSNNYDLEKRLQSEDRAHRIGQTNKVTYIDIVCKDTVDEKIVKALRSKMNIANEIMGEDLKDWI